MNQENYRGAYLNDYFVITKLSPARLLVLALVFCYITPVLAMQSKQWTFALRVAASFEFDAQIIALAQNSAETDIYQNGDLVARWISVRKKIENRIRDEPELTTRINDKGQCQVLVLINSDDPSESDLQRIRVREDAKKKTDLVLQFSRTGSSNLFTFTRNNINRHVAVVMDDIIISIPKIYEPLFSTVILKSSFTSDEIKTLQQRIGSPLFYDPAEADFTGFWILVIVVCSIILFYPVVVFVAVKRKKVAPLTAIFTVVGMIFFACLFGLDINYDNIKPFSMGFQNFPLMISFIELFVGAVFGAVLGIPVAYLSRHFFLHDLHVKSSVTKNHPNNSTE